MKVEQKGHTTILKDTIGDTASFLMKVTHEHNSFKNYNLILDLSHDQNLTLEVVKSFTELIKLHKKQKKSIVLVADSVDFNAVPKNIILVPTILEAHDIIEMEEIERDLGF
ncbi:ribonuclease Z [Flavobacterium sp. TBRC 19031]|uniref:ribonuclease Z n=1 Tax=Flavobacterium mekongense TaxID=3379707 RepID=UPI00399B7D36